MLSEITADIIDLPICSARGVLCDELQIVSVQTPSSMNIPEITVKFRRNPVNLQLMGNLNLKAKKPLYK